MEAASTMLGSSNNAWTVVEDREGDRDIGHGKKTIDQYRCHSWALNISALTRNHPMKMFGELGRGDSRGRILSCHPSIGNFLDFWDTWSKLIWEGQVKSHLIPSKAAGFILD